MSKHLMPLSCLSCDAQYVVFLWLTFNLVFISWMIFTCIVLKLLHLKWNVSPVRSDPSSPVFGSPSLGPQEWLTSSSGEDLESKPSSYQLSFAVEMAKKQSSTSISSNLKRLLTPSLHLPYSGQQGLAEEHKRRTQSSCIPNNTPGKIAFLGFTDFCFVFFSCVK